MFYLCAVSWRIPLGYTLHYHFSQSRDPINRKTRLLVKKLGFGYFWGKMFWGNHYVSQQTERSRESLGDPSARIFDVFL